MNRSPVRFWEAAPTKLWPSKPLIGPAWSCPGRRFGHFRSAHAPLLARAVHDAGSRRPTPDEHSPDELRCTGTVSNKQRGGAEVMRGGSSERTRRAWTVTVIAVMLAWFGITNHVPLEPLNDLSQQGDQLPSTLAGFIPFVLAILTVLFVPNFWLVLFWTGYAYVWLALQIGRASCRER